ncbi:MAG: triose-phosphate isomerase [Ignavibacteria bacterium]
MIRKLIAGNWKMNLNPVESETLIKNIVQKIEKKFFDKVDVLICPTYVALEIAARMISGTGIKLGAQNLHYENDGAYTGEISASILKAIGCEYVIIGHSERRKYLHEKNDIINKKIKKAIEFELKPILCVGETFEEREDEIYEGVVEDQLKEGLFEMTDEQIKKVIIAYEPVWAIGTGLNATPTQASDMHAFIGKIVSKLFGDEIANELPILYGGSVNEKNASQILSACGIDGALVGGASLLANEFAEIVKAAYEI